MDQMRPPDLLVARILSAVGPGSGPARPPTRPSAGIAFALWSIPLSATAQTVETLDLARSVNVDGLYGAPDGNLYAAAGWNGSTVYKVGTDGSLTNVAAGIDGPIHMAMDADGSLYVSAWNSARIHRIDPEGNGSVFAMVDPFPAGLAFGPDGFLYIAHSPPTGLGGVTRVDPEGQASSFASGSGINRPVGIAFDDDGNLYVANLYNTRISKITPAGAISAFAEAPTRHGTFSVGHLVYSGGFLYASNIGNHQILKISLAGNVEVFAGTGTSGHVDGGASEARFNRPNGLAVSAGGASLVTASVPASSYFQTVSLNLTTGSATPPSLPSGLAVEGPFPNPASGTARIIIDPAGSGLVSCTIHDVLGREVSKPLVGSVLNGPTDLDLPTNGLTTGLYLIRVESEHAQLVLPLVVSR
jgi:sugar lactone lactonase YvrE